MEDSSTAGNQTKTTGSSKLEAYLPSWEFLVLLAFMVTVFGLATQGSLQSLPDQSSRARFEQFERDPYDVRPERSLSDARNLVETGL